MRHPHRNFSLIASQIFTLLALWITAASGADETVSLGLYKLIKVNGLDLPASVAHGEVEIDVRSGTLRIDADGSCSSRVVFVPPGGSEFTREVSATYTRVGMTLNMSWRGAGRTTGTFEGDTFTMNNEGMDFTYKYEAELAGESVLDRLVGTWRSSHKRIVPEDDGAMEESATLIYSRVLGGRFVEERRANEGHPEALAMYRYDAGDDSYHMWRFDSRGKVAEASGRWDSAAATLTWIFDAEDGERESIVAKQRFEDTETFNWEASATSQSGDVTYRVEGEAARVDNSGNGTSER